MARINETVVGRCSNCGGEVVEPVVFHSVVRPAPTCNRCGATAATQGPTIPMNPPPKRESIGLPNKGA